MQYLIYVLAFYVLSIGIRYLLIFQRLCRAVLQYPRYTIKADTDVPNFVAGLFISTGETLKSWGFEPCCYARVDLMSAGEKRWQQLWYCDRSQTFAWLSIPALPSSTQAVNVDFETFLADGTLLLTINGRSHYIILPMPATIIQDPYSPSLEAQWQLHRDRVEAIAPQNPPKLLSPESFLELLASHETATLSQALVQKKLYRTSDSKDLNLSLVMAARAAIQIGSGARQEALLLRQRQPFTQAPINIPVEAEIEAYHSLELWETRRTRNSLKWGILAISLALFMLLARFFFDTQTVIILIGVLFLHEFGHFSAMRLFGYQDTSIFFLPLFGAAASGRKDNATLTEQVMVLLAGPIPGLLIGAGLAVFLAMAGLTAGTLTGLTGLSIWLVLLNYLNLLPVLPLDGGRIMNLLVFSRHAYAEIFFKIFTVILLAIAGLGLHDPILLPLAVLTALTIPASFRSSKIIKFLHRNTPAVTEGDSFLQELFKAVKTAGYETLPFAQKYRLVKDLAQRYQEPRASLLARLSLLGLYIFCLLAGLGAIAVTFWLSW
jgi:Zn-dependent protease